MSDDNETPEIPDITEEEYKNKVLSIAMDNLAYTILLSLANGLVVYYAWNWFIHSPLNLPSIGFLTSFVIQLALNASSQWKIPDALEWQRAKAWQTDQRLGYAMAALVVGRLCTLVILFVMKSIFL